MKPKQEYPGFKGIVPNDLIEWYRVSSSNEGKTEIICADCLRTPPATERRLLNRVFGATQTCAWCGASDKKAKN